MTDDEFFDRRDELLREPPEKIVRCLSCGASHYECDRCERCDHQDEYEVA